jgi:hypothetical protein
MKRGLKLMFILSLLYYLAGTASVSAQWTPPAEAVCTTSDIQQLPRLVSDGSNGAIISWSDRRDPEIINRNDTRDGIALCNQRLIVP